MNLNDDLIGTVVHVHPNVTCLLSKQNHVGVISEANFESDNYYVDFEDRFTGLYGADALAILLPTPHLSKNLESLIDIPADIHKAVQGILENNDVMEKINLMRLVRNNPDIYELCTLSLQEHNAQYLTALNKAIL
jgi:hypothetical protein